MKTNDLYKNIKSGRNYKVLSMRANNATNGFEGQVMCIYTSETLDDPATFIFVREINEFHEKFIKINK